MRTRKVKTNEFKPVCKFPLYVPAVAGRIRDALFAMAGMAAVAAIALGRSGLAGETAGWLVAAAGVAAALFGPVTALAGDIVVGLDGIRVRKGWRREFFRFADLATVERVDVPVAERQRGGTMYRWIERVVLLKTAAGRGIELSLGRDEAAAADFVGLVESGIARASVSRVRIAIGREGRRLGEWRAALEKSLSPGFREVGLDATELEQVLSSTGAPTEDRIGAALALRSARVEGSQERIRIAADASASESIRKALQAVAKDELDEQALEEALAEDEAPQPGDAHVAVRVIAAISSSPDAGAPGSR
jgi:hypothetical protein